MSNAKIAAHDSGSAVQRQCAQGEPKMRPAHPTTVPATSVDRQQAADPVTTGLWSRRSGLLPPCPEQEQQAIVKAWNLS
jgi:hypothetical protein